MNMSSAHIGLSKKRVEKSYNSLLDAVSLLKNNINVPNHTDLSTGN